VVSRHVRELLFTVGAVSETFTHRIRFMLACSFLKPTIYRPLRIMKLSTGI
jgi:hypothetical protein